MTAWSRYLFGASIFFGAGVMMLGGRVSEWWTVFSIAIMFLAAGVFLIRSAVEFRRTRGRVERATHQPSR